MNIGHVGFMMAVQQSKVLHKIRFIVRDQNVFASYPSHEIKKNVHCEFIIRDKNRKTNDLHDYISVKAIFNTEKRMIVRGIKRK